MLHFLHNFLKNEKKIQFSCLTRQCDAKYPKTHTHNFFFFFWVPFPPTRRVLPPQTPPKTRKKAYLGQFFTHPEAKATPPPDNFFFFRHPHMCFTSGTPSIHNIFLHPSKIMHFPWRNITLRTPKPPKSRTPPSCDATFLKKSWSRRLQFDWGRAPNTNFTSQLV